MKYSVILSSIFFTSCVQSMNCRSITIENTTNEVVSVAYREPACTLVEKVRHYSAVTISSPTPFLAIMNQGKIERFPIGYNRHHFVIEWAKNNYKYDVFKIVEYDDKYIARSKNDCLDDRIFQ